MSALDEFKAGYPEDREDGGFMPPRTRYSSGVTEEQKNEYTPLGTNLKEAASSTAQKLYTMSHADDARGAIMRGVGTGIQGVGTAYNWITEPMKYAAEEGEISPEATLGHLLIGGEKLTKMGGTGAEMWATGADIQNPITKQSMGNLPRRKDGQPWVDPDVARTTGEIATGTLLDIGAGKGIQQLGKLTKGLKIADNLTPSPVAVTADGLRINPANVTDDLARQSAQPLQVGHKMERSTRTDNLEGLIRADAPNKQIRDFLQEGPGGAIKPKYREISADQLAAKPELLEQLFKRNKNIKTLQEKYLTKLSQWQKNPRPTTQAAKNNAQRAWYDEVSKNLFDHEMLIYGKDKPRQIVAQATKWATRDQWHHIFGNKEAGEFFLSMAAQDPLVVTNLMKHMKKLKLSTSGIADNIAIMKATGHNNLHLWLKEMGFESVAGKQAPLAIDQYATEISKYITEGVQTTAVSGKPKFYPPNPDAVNDLFEILEYYSEANKFIRKKLKAGKITMEDGTVLSLASGKTNKLPEVMSELKSKKISGVGDVLRSGELMKQIKVGTRGRKRSKKS